MRRTWRILALSALVLSACDGLSYDIDSVELRTSDASQLSDAGTDASQDTGDDLSQSQDTGDDLSQVGDLGADLADVTNDVQSDTAGETDTGPTDSDGVGDVDDNCPRVENAEQLDFDGDGDGDACDDDIDGDSVLNVDDNCPRVPNAEQTDEDGNGVGDVCEGDADGDGVDDADDNCPLVPNDCQWDYDDDGLGNSCDPDIDDDGVDNAMDNCPRVANASQDDADSDGEGDACDPGTGLLCNLDTVDIDGVCDAVRQDCPDCEECVMVYEFTRFSKSCAAVDPARSFILEEGEACQQNGLERCKLGLFCLGLTGQCVRYCRLDTGEGCQSSQTCVPFNGLNTEWGYCDSDMNLCCNIDGMSCSNDGDCCSGTCEAGSCCSINPMTGMCP